MSDINITVQKYNPSVDAEPYYVTYQVPWKEHMTALEALHYINEKFEPIAFDYSCRGSLCGRCSVNVDGKPILACYAPLTEEDHTIEPQAGFNVVHDLVVDKTVFSDAISDLGLSVRSPKSLDNEDLPAIPYDFWWQDLHRLQMCRECGNCMSVCPVRAADLLGFAGPALVSQVALRLYDGIDETNRAIQAFDLGVQSCLECHACEAVCPAHIPHVELHQMMKQTLAEKGYVA